MRKIRINEERVFRLIRDNEGIKFGKIWKKLYKESEKHFRPLDRALQKLRKAGSISYDNGWYAKIDE